MSDVVEVLAPDPSTGEMRPATVAAADLPAAIEAGAVKAPVVSQNERVLGGGLGQAAAGAFGAARSATGGASDALLVEGANIVGGQSARSDMLQGLNAAKDTNPYATMGGEAAGLFIGAGKGVGATGEAVENAVANRLGDGLLGKVGSYAARGAAEGALIGAQNQISEDTLGDVDSNGEKVFAAAGKGALFGGAIGAGFGGVAHFGSEAISALRKPPGPVASGLLDEVAGVEGAGQSLRDDARAAQGLVEDLQAAGTTSEQGAVLADQVNDLAKARAASGPFSGVADEASWAKLAEGLQPAAAAEHAGPASSLIDAQAARWAKARAAGNTDLEEVLMKGYSDRASKLANQESALDATARTLADKGTAAMRNLEDTINDAQFTQKAEQVKKLVDPSKWEAARDASMKSLQDVDGVLKGLESTAGKGGSEVAVSKLRKQLTDFYTANAAIRGAGRIGVTDASDKVGDYFMRLDALKKSVDKFAQHGTVQFGRTEAANEFRALADRLRGTLEDESVWGGAGAAQRELNSTFSLAKGRADDFGRRFSVAIDQTRGVPVPELDAGKLKSALRNIDGAEGDQAVKTTQAYIDGLRARASAVEKHLALDPEAAEKLAIGKKSLDEFANQFADSRKEASVISRLRTQQLEEHGKSLGGVLGLATDIMTRPLQTMERLGALKHATERFEKGIANGIDRFFSGKGSSFVQRFDQSAEAVQAARPKAEIANEIGQLRELAGNPSAMQTKVAAMLGDVSSFAPKIGGSAAVTAMRALTFLATEAPTPRAEITMLGTKPTLRFSDQEINVYENKRNAAFHPQTVVDELNLGKLNRDGIRTVKVVYPQMFAMMQNTARTQLAAMDQKGLLDAMPYERKAAIASLLEVAPDGTWKPDFMALMQSTKEPAPAPQTTGPAPSPPKGGGRRPIKMNTAAFSTEAQQIEGRTT